MKILEDLEGCQDPYLQVYSSIIEILARVISGHEDPGRPGQLEELEGCKDPTCRCTALITEILAR